VAKGYVQMYGIDYDETVAPVVRFSSIRTLLAFAIQNSLLIYQMDVVTAFLNGTLSEEIYMQPDGYIQVGNEHLVCRFHYVREAVQDEVICLQYCPTIADLLTKELPRQKYERLRRAMGMDSVCKL